MPTIEVAIEDKAKVMARRRETPDKERKYESAASVVKRMIEYVEAAEAKTGTKVV
jgi:hypothetical protein